MKSIETDSYFSSVNSTTANIGKEKVLHSNPYPLNIPRYDNS